MNEIIFRVATLDDLTTLYEFEQRIISAERPFDPTLKPGHINYYDIKVMIQSNDTEVIVALVGDEIISSGYVRIEKSESYLKHDYHAYLGYMYVKPEYRGKGVIQKLIEELKSWAKSRNTIEIRLDVYSDNHPAVRAYEKTGFKKHLVEMRMEI